MEPTVGIEPTTYGLRYRCSTIEPGRQKRVTGIEPVYQPWEGCILPLNHTRDILHNKIIYDKNQ